MMRRTAKPIIAAMLCLSALSACGGLDAKTGEDKHAEWLRSLKEAEQSGEIGSVEGLLHLSATGVPIPLRDWPVILMPLPPAMETAIAEVAHQYAAGGSAPLPSPAFARAHRMIDAYLRRLERTGYSDLIRRVKTDPGRDPVFRFADVPQGRWLLLAELPSAISRLLWAFPVTVQAGATTRQSLNDSNIWVEGLLDRP